MEETENHHHEDAAAVESGRCCLEEGLKEWYKWLSNELQERTLFLCSSLQYNNILIYEYFHDLQHGRHENQFTAMEKRSGFSNELGERTCGFRRVNSWVSKISMILKMSYELLEHMKVIGLICVE